MQKSCFFYAYYCKSQTIPHPQYCKLLWKLARSCIVQMTVMQVNISTIQFDLDSCRKVCGSLSHPQKMSKVLWHFHSIVCHAAPQCELVSLRAVNAENEERMFGQADKITGNTTNRHPNHVSLQLRVQAQAKRRDNCRAGNPNSENCISTSKVKEYSS